MDRIFQGLASQDRMHPAPANLALPVIFTTVEKPREIVVRFEINELPAFIRELTEVMLHYSSEPDTLSPQESQRGPVTANAGQ